MPRWVTAALAVLAGLLLIATAAFAVVQQRELSALRDDVRALESRVIDLQETVDQSAESSDAEAPPGLDLPAVGSASLDGCLDQGDVAPIDVATLDEQLDAIAARVGDVRDLEPAEPLEHVMLDSAAFDGRVAQMLREHYPDEHAEQDRRMLAAVGAIDADTDVRGLLEGLLGDQVVGFYDEETGELVLRREDPDALLAPHEQATYAHEVQHALADQRFGLPTAIHQPGAESDEALAGQSLAEGDASLTMQRFAVGALGMPEQLAMLGEGLGELGALASYPAFFRESLTFPYEEGLAFVCALYAEGGWEAVNAAYDAPPTTSAQIMFPQRYADGESPAEPPSLAGPGEGWRETDTDSLGAAPLSWLFAAPGDDPAAALDDPKGRAGAWDGGEATLWTDGSDSAVGLALVDGSGDGTLCDSMARWYEAAFADAEVTDGQPDERLASTGGDQEAVITCDGADVRVGLAPDVATARVIAGSTG